MNTKALLIINRDDVLFLNPIEKVIKSNNLYKTVYYTDFFKKRDNKKEYLKQSIKIMSKYFLFNYLIKSFVKLIFSKCPMPSRLKKNMSLEHLCLYYGYKLKKVDSVNSKEFQDTITLNDINVVLSITSQIYSREIINIPMLKIYNFHPSILPNNKGRFPIFWAILNNSQQGMTCHEITEQIDSGKIIHQMILPRVKSVEDGMRNVINNFGDFINISIKVIQGEVEGNVVEGEPSFYGPTPQNSDILKYKAISS